MDRALGDSLSGPSLVSWNLTRHCNLRCPHCYLDAAAIPGAGELSAEEAVRVVDQLADLSPGAMLVFSGGEPLLRADLPSLVRQAAGRGLAPVLGTNGTLLDEVTLRDLADRGLAGVGVSLDSPEPGYHDAFRGKTGAWRQAMGAMEACRRLEMPFQIHTSLTRENRDCLYSMAELSARLGAMAFNLFFLVCTGRGERLTDIAPQEYEQALANLADLQGSFPEIKLRARCAPQFTRILAERGGPGSEVPAGCMAGHAYLRLSPEGKVTPCPYLPLEVGDLRRQSLFGIWRDSPLLQELREGRWQGRCGDCSFAAHCQGCRARAYALSGDYLGEDPWCTYDSANGSDARSVGRLSWQDDARRRMERAPAFIRERAMAHIEAYARERGCREVTVEILEEVRSSRPSSWSRLPFRH